MVGCKSTIKPIVVQKHPLKKGRMFYKLFGDVVVVVFV
jgi:hypothetical protein